MQKKAGNPKELPAQGQYVSRHMRKPRVSSAFVLATLSCLEVVRARTRRTCDNAVLGGHVDLRPPRRIVHALSGLRPRRTPMPERR